MIDRRVHADVLEVTSLEQLAAITDVRPWRWIVSPKTISLRIPSVDRAVQQATERRLNLSRAACGCQVGALLVLVSLVWYVSGPARAFDATLEAVLYGGALAVGVGILGKAVTVLIARAIFIAEGAFFVRRIRREARQGRLTR